MRIVTIFERTSTRAYINIRLHHNSAVNTPIEEQYEHGAKFAKAVYGDSHDGMQTLMEEIYPDLGMHTYHTK